MLLFVLCGLMSGQAWGGPFSAMKSKLNSSGANEYYSVGNGYYVECDDDTGDAPAKTRAYWYSGGVWSRRCFISGSLTGDDRWTDKESVSRCANNSCNSANPREKLPNTSSYYICGKQNQGIKTIGDSVFVGGGTSDVVDCYFYACDKDHPAATSGANIPSSSKRSATCGEGDDPNASGCEEVCVETSGVAKWVKYVTKCKGNMKLGGYHNFGYTKCEDAAGSSVVNIECPAGSFKNITSQENCEKNQTFECASKKDGKCICGKCKVVASTQPAESSLDRCLKGRSSAEGKACCYLPNNVAKWENNKCVCQTPNMEFKIGSGGKGQCVAKQVAPGATFDCESSVVLALDTWLLQCAAKPEVISVITQIKTLCASPARTVDSFNVLFSTLLALNPGDCAVAVQPVQQVQPVVPVDDTAEKLRKSRRNISDAHGILVGMRETFKTSVWKDEEGKFNTSRLVSDSIAGVVLGTVGGVVTSSVVKKNQVENGFEDIKCTVGGQTVADWGDEFRVGIQ